MTDISSPSFMKKYRIIIYDPTKYVIYIFPFKLQHFCVNRMMYELSLKQQYSCDVHSLHFLIAHNQPIKIIQRNLNVKLIICLKNKTIIISRNMHVFPQCFCILKNKRTNTKIQLKRDFPVQPYSATYIQEFQYFSDYWWAL